MAEIGIRCPHCGTEAKAPPEFAGKTAECPSCGKDFRIPIPEPAPPPSAPKRAAPVPLPATQQPQPMPEKKEVVVTDIKMPFGSMVVFMIKWAIAAIPAFIILAILGLIVSTVFMGGCAALLSAAR